MHFLSVKYYSSVQITPVAYRDVRIFEVIKKTYVATSARWKIDLYRHHDFYHPGDAIILLFHIPFQDLDIFSDNCQENYPQLVKSHLFPVAAKLIQPRCEHIFLRYKYPSIYSQVHTIQ